MPTTLSLSTVCVAIATLLSVMPAAAQQAVAPAASTAAASPAERRSTLDDQQ